MRVVDEEAKTLVLSRLEPTPDGTLGLPWAAAEDLALAFELRFGPSGEGTLAELQDVLRMVVVLERDERSVLTAERLLGALRRSSSVRALLTRARIDRDAAGRKKTARFAHFEGRAVVVAQAPRHDTPRPAGALSGRELMRPLPRARGLNR